jgi:NAD(P)-dependent dehydrogenase (short-subunit alcohol dehydrogenase family)
VHAVHGLLWSLDAAAAAGIDLAPYRGLAAQFLKAILLGDEVAARMSMSAGDLTIVLEAGGLAATHVRLTREPPDAAGESPQNSPALISRRTAARPLALEAMAGCEGALDYGAPALAEAFPAAAASLGLAALEGLAATTYVVGMECPGLHSLYSRLAAALDPEAPRGRVTFRAVSVDPRFRLVDLVVRTPAVAARIAAFARVPPVAPPAMADLSTRVIPGELAGQRALVVGGSRGLGATTAKLLAAAGADVVITYARGVGEAAAAAEDIAGAGGCCAIMPYDALAPAGPQLASAALAINALYYFATGPIWRRRSRAFEPAVMRDLMRFHVDGFADLVEAVRLRTEGRLVVFYPSSAYAAEIPKDLGEYAAAKRAGEAVAQNLAASLKDVAVIAERLPPVDTDQNATVAAPATLSPVDVMLPIVRRVQAAL